ncbi:unnamed protein product [Staphylococcus haemolyticus JCSC1435]|uniref:Uncharacterized protein n=1 Tax=Staphylococcus haemolyticus (strain JCSC1435) TaxID=279808 RepID=Q4LA89_STAHJ|nr:unnamed protein product [Staphylococcus haemolyticus JCSC1435]
MNISLMLPLCSLYSSLLSSCFKLINFCFNLLYTLINVHYNIHFYSFLTFNKYYNYIISNCHHFDL